eukprot:10641210-Prorocentrum_lima.AAC.1
MEGYVVASATEQNICRLHYVGGRGRFRVWTTSSSDTMALCGRDRTSTTSFASNVGWVVKAWCKMAPR